MVASSIGWILLVSGIATAGAGLAALFPRMLLRLFGIDDGGSAVTFFVRHWGALIFVIGGLIVYAAYVPAVRAPVLAAAALEKIVIVALIFFGPLKRTPAMTAIAIADGIFAALYVAYLARL